MNNWNFKIGDEHAHRLALARKYPISIRELQAIVNQSAVKPTRCPDGHASTAPVHKPATAGCMPRPVRGGA